TLHSKVKCRFRAMDENGNLVTQLVSSTPGRMLISEILPKSVKLPFQVVNKLMTKKEISNLIYEVYRHCVQKETVIFADRLMGLGFKHAAKAGISFGKDDMIVPETKEKHLA